METLNQTGWALDTDAIARLADEGIAITREDGCLVIRVDESNPLRDAKSKIDKRGNVHQSKSQLFASSHGLATIGQTPEGRGVYLSLNAGVYREPRNGGRRNGGGRTQADVDAAVRAALAQQQAQQQAAIDAAVRAALAQAAAQQQAAPAPAPQAAQASGNVVAGATVEGQAVARARARRAAQQAAPQQQTAPAPQKPQRPRGKAKRLSLVK